MKNICAIACALLLANNAFAADEDSTETENPAHFAQHINNNYNSIKDQVCNQLDLSVNIEASPFLYTDPEASCDLGFQMPGLPDFNLGFDGIDSCSLLKAVTGELVNQINTEMRDAVTGAIDGVGLDSGGDIDIDFGDIVINEVTGN